MEKIPTFERCLLRANYTLECWIQRVLSLEKAWQVPGLASDCDCAADTVGQGRDVFNLHGPLFDIPYDGFTG